MTPVFDDDTRNPGWYLHGGLDMSVPFFSKEDLYVANTMRLGRRSIAQTLKCAYFGTPLKAVEDRGLWYAVPVDNINTSLFSTSERRFGRDMLLWLCSHRNGKDPGFPKPEPVTAAEPPADHEHFVDTTEGLAQNSGDDYVEDVVNTVTGG